MKSEKKSKPIGKLSSAERAKIKASKKKTAALAITAALIEAGVPKEFAKTEAKNATRHIGEDLDGHVPAIVYGQVYLHLNPIGATITVGNDAIEGPYVGLTYDHFGHQVNNVRLPVKKPDFELLAELFASARFMVFGKESRETVRASLYKCRPEGYTGL